eukprot:m.35059 g.35059  ORF g.35059 m.35059 type:complete len:90 (-) comp11098_c0_seq2:62-331(-)
MPSCDFDLWLTYPCISNYPFCKRLLDRQSAERKRLRTRRERDRIGGRDSEEDHHREKKHKKDRKEKKHKKDRKHKRDKKKKSKKHKSRD